MLNQEVEVADLLGVTYFGKPDMPLAAEAQKGFTIATSEGLFAPTRVPQGVLNATAYFQGVMTKFLTDLNCNLWVDDTVRWGADEGYLLNTLDKILGCLEDASLSAAAYKYLFFDTEISGVEMFSKGDRCFTTGSV